MFTVLWEYHFCAMHRLVDHPGKCRHIHGHNYVAKLQVCRFDGQLDDMGMVVDFATLKGRVGSWIDRHWDHNSILWVEDNILKLGRLMKAQGYWVDEFAQFDDRPPYVLSSNPTAENLAKELCAVATGIFVATPVRVLSAFIEEQPGKSAFYTPAKE
jgi:6-pyruvoyltetrahydropterin/6-carboxytetrahydropterin synthase